MLRITLAALVLALTSLLIGGCGSSNHSASGSITKAQAVAFARAVNLTPRDLPGSEPVPTEEPFASLFETAPRQRRSESFRCGSKGAHALAIASSGPGAIAVHLVAVLPSPDKLPPQFKRSGKPADFHIAGTLFRVGPAEIELVTFGTEGFSAASERSLLTRIYGRAKAHTL